MLILVQVQSKVFYDPSGERMLSHGPIRIPTCNKEILNFNEIRAILAILAIFDTNLAGDGDRSCWVIVRIQQLHIEIIVP